MSSVSMVSSSSFAFCLVDRWFLRAWSRCPLVVAMEWGGYFARFVWLSPGNPVMYSCCKALLSVEMTGENKVACANFTRSEAVPLSNWAVALATL